jgi:hypothetical protein
METVFINLLTPELVKITKNKNKLISYGNFFDIKLVYSLAWIYKYYFEESVLLFLPRCINITESLEQFNELVGDYPLLQEEITHCTLETLENTSSVKVVIYGFGDLIFNELSILNKRRVNSRLKALKCKVHILSYTSLKILDLIALDSFELNFKESFPKFQFEYIDFLDSEQEIFDENLIAFADFISENEAESIYISLNIHISKILTLEKLLKERNVNVSRKESANCVVINSQKTINSSFLKYKYQLYIFITQDFEYPLDFLFYLKEIHSEAVVYIDSSKIKNINSVLKRITTEDFPERTVIKDSKEYPSYNELIKEVSGEALVVSESYYLFEAPESLQKLNLSNLAKKDYDLIRNFVKLKLNTKLDNLKTCQLSAPCSPKDRSKKLNSLSNKISSSDYRCDITCEIFKDYTIGVVLWNDTFSNRKSISVLKNQTFVYQTTSGKWKYTSVT